MTKTLSTETPPTDSLYLHASTFSQVHTPNYGVPSLVLTRGQGCTVWDTDGHAYLDAAAGIAVCTLGHAHPALVTALTQQAQQLWHVSNIFTTPPTLELARALGQASHLPEAKVFFCNSGAEANEASIKLARKYGRIHKGITQPEVIVFGHGFHGRTLGALAATPKEAYQAPFAPMVAGFAVAELNNLASVQALTNANTVAVLVEPLQGEGGILPTCPVFLKDLRAWCDANGLLLMFDEVQCGIGRCGEVFAYHGLGVQPDVVSLAKGLGGGFPIGAMVATGAVASVLQPGDHGTTYGGNPLACAVALAVLQQVQTPEFLAHVQSVGQQLRTGLEALQHRHPHLIANVRGRGLMLGVELRPEAVTVASVVAKARDEQRLLVLSAGSHVLRLVPPLILTPTEAEAIVHKLDAVFSAV
ncbi:MAG: aspartate aminotransferase family protein [Vampirovibrionales bacterium]